MGDARSRSFDPARVSTVSSDRWVCGACLVQLHSSSGCRRSGGGGPTLLSERCQLDSSHMPAQCLCRCREDDFEALKHAALQGVKGSQRAHTVVLPGQQVGGRLVALEGVAGRCALWGHPSWGWGKTGRFKAMLLQDSISMALNSQKPARPGAARCVPTRLPAPPVLPLRQGEGVQVVDLKKLDRATQVGGAKTWGETFGVWCVAGLSLERST